MGYSGVWNSENPFIEYSSCYEIRTVKKIEDIPTKAELMLRKSFETGIPIVFLKKYILALTSLVLIIHLPIKILVINGD